MTRFIHFCNGRATLTVPPYLRGSPRSHVLQSFGAAGIGGDRALARPIHPVKVPKEYAVSILGPALEREDQCKSQYDNYTDPEIFDHWYEGHVHASNLASCISIRPAPRVGQVRVHDRLDHAGAHPARAPRARPRHDRRRPADHAAAPPRVPVKLMCDYAVRWRVKKADGESSLSGASYRTVIQKSVSWIFRTVSSELTPCMYSEPALLPRRGGRPRMALLRPISQSRVAGTCSDGRHHPLDHVLRAISQGGCHGRPVPGRRHRMHVRPEFRTVLDEITRFRDAGRSHLPDGAR
ncbi:hypothetical protein F5Y14DRAFT_271405 [Nemania sp. NC0429]|nr:hypothetical protein F5Y14DRAFT_271405 [Nemania sp. NC0429]